MARFLNGLICLVCTVLGVTLAFGTNAEFQAALREALGADPKVVLGVVLGGVGYLFGATFSFEFSRWLEDVLPRLRVRDLLFGGGGAMAGMFLANLAILPMIVVLNVGHVAEVLGNTPVGRVMLPVGLLLVPASLNLFFGYLGATFLLRKQTELAALLLGGREQDLLQLPKAQRYLLDTSAIIDGRVLALQELGVFKGPMVAPRFVLDELQLLGDSSDPLKRSKGRRGLDYLEKIKRAASGGFSLPDDTYENLTQVDDKLLRYAASEPCTLVTNDYNLAKRAAVEGIETLSLHQLAEVMQPPVLAGEQLVVEVAKRGEKEGQGVAYLADGSMVIVRGGADRIGERITVLIEKCLQTGAGRMFFSRPFEESIPPPRRLHPEKASEGA